MVDVRSPEKTLNSDKDNIDDQNVSLNATQRKHGIATRSSKKGKFYELAAVPDSEPSMTQEVSVPRRPVEMIQFCLPANKEVANGDQPTKKRLCRFPGCERVIKSQGHCQRHGAKVKRCSHKGCTKQAQGQFNGMCKQHWREINDPPPAEPQPEFPEPEGESVYDKILPQSVGFRPTAEKNMSQTDKEGEDKIEDIIASPPFAIMPLVKFINDGVDRAPGWHRNDERRARGIPEVSSLHCQLESWEKQLALVEILLLSGGTPYASFKNLAHAWGREKGWHLVLCNSVCERRGGVERFKRKKDFDIDPNSSPKSDLKKKSKNKA